MRESKEIMEFLDMDRQRVSRIYTKKNHAELLKLERESM